MLGQLLGESVLGSLFFRRRDRPRVAVQLLALVTAAVGPAAVWSLTDHPLISWLLVQVAYVGGYWIGRLLLFRTTWPPAGD
jgi:hypothetical protein